MYIEIHNWEEYSQKVAYFKLNNAFNMDINSELNYKLAGIYAIYKDDICLYVGQSKNLASRLATHLKGKYKASTCIYLWNIEELGFSDFNIRDKQSQLSILENSEKYIMGKLKPIENILFDINFELTAEEQPAFKDYEEYYLADNKEYILGYSSNIKIILDEKKIIITNEEETFRINKIGMEADNLFFKPFDLIDKEIIELYNLVLKLNNDNILVAKAN